MDTNTENIVSDVVLSFVKTHRTPKQSPAQKGNRNHIDEDFRYAGAEEAIAEFEKNEEEKKKVASSFRKLAGTFKNLIIRFKEELDGIHDEADEETDKDAEKELPIHINNYDAKPLSERHDNKIKDIGNYKDKVLEEVLWGYVGQM